MRTVALVLALVGWLSPAVAMAQAQAGCAACVSAASCDGKEDSCVAECRARLFSIDPKRPACIADCSNKSSQCVQAANTACRSRNLCR
jgi:hypothetical protein